MLESDPLAGRKTLAVLAGGQITPNMYAVRMLSPERLIIFHTDHPDSRSAADRIKQYAGIPSPSLCYLRNGVDIWAVKEDIQTNLSQLGVDLNDLVLHATSGTKPMSIGTLEFARGVRDATIPVLYFEGKFHLLHPPGQSPPNSLSQLPNLTIEEFILWQEARYRPGKRRPTEAIKTKTAQEMGKNFRTFKSLSEARLEMAQHPSKPLWCWKRSQSQSQWQSLLQTAKDEGLLENFSVKPPSKDRCDVEITWARGGLQYLAGEWLEDYVFMEMQKIKSCTDLALGLKVLDSQGREVTDLDVAAMVKGNLVWLSCKTGKADETLVHFYELLARRTGMGGFRTKTVLITTLQENTSNPKVNRLKRDAKIARMEVLFQEHLNGLQKKLESIL